MHAFDVLLKGFACILHTSEYITKKALHTFCMQIIITFDKSMRIAYNHIIIKYVPIRRRIYGKIRIYRYRK